MNSTQTIGLFYGHVHRQALRLLETWIWLQDLRKWEAEEDVAGSGKWETGMISRILYAVSEFMAVLLVVESSTSFGFTPVSAKPH